MTNEKPLRDITVRQCIFHIKTMMMMIFVMFSFFLVAIFTAMLPYGGTVMASGVVGNFVMFCIFSFLVLVDNERRRKYKERKLARKMPK